MSTLIRHDAIKLKPGVKEEDFLKFMTEILMPFFKSTYKKLTRVTIANLTDQTVLKDLKKERRYLWINSWAGTESSISDPSFKGVLMTNIREDETNAMLRKLQEFGRRTIDGVYEAASK